MSGPEVTEQQLDELDELMRRAVADEPSEDLARRVEVGADLLLRVFSGNLDAAGQPFPGGWTFDDAGRFIRSIRADSVGVDPAGLLVFAVRLREAARRVRAEGEARAMVRRLVDAMRVWGSWGDEAGNGDVGAAYDAARAMLGLGPEKGGAL